MNIKGVILAAGVGARLAPITPFVPKEMLPICGFPAIHHALVELYDSGLREVMIVVSSGKSSLVSYLTDPVLPKGADATRLLAERDKLLSEMHVVFVEQKQLNGTAGAILLAEDFMGDDPLIVLYPDDILTVVGKCADGIVATSDLVRTYRRTGLSTVLTTEIPGKVAHDYGVLTLVSRDEVFFVTQIVEKPQNYMGDRANILIGRMLLTPKTVRSIRSFELTDESGIIPILSDEASREALAAVRYRGRRYDIGSQKGYAATLRALI